ncbi:Hemagglutinin repeat protein [Sporomusa termitida]|uniref:Hemagglutinin repeat protein n=2 Tax=Sporomusa termitida TaxID=2377 RepID=A0A517DRJ1_9FIRM|nr:Hemagglutinin repeat protein [Sporomusa termitida]
MPVIKDFHIFKYGGPGLFAGLKPLPDQPFIFHLAPKCLHWCVVPTVALPGHAANKSALFEYILIILRAILAATIGVNEYAVGRPSSLVTQGDGSLESFVLLQPAVQPGHEDLKQAIKVSVSIGSSKSSSEQTVHISAGNTVTIMANAGNVNLTGTKIDAQDITIKAVGDINLKAAQNQQQVQSDSKSSAWGAGLELGTGIFGSYQQGRSNENASTTTHSGSSLIAADTITLVSGQDTNLIGSQVEGAKVVAVIGADLNIASLQDIDNYSANSKNTGIRVGIGSGITGSFSKGQTNSAYQSVTEQAGIYVGKDGFNIEVGGNTDLKGAVIASEATADKNKLSTDTLTFSDIENKAEYSASSTGVNLDTRKTADTKDAGYTPNIGVKVSDDADSTTTSAIAAGTIEIRSNPNQDVSGLSRDTANSLNALGKIFDKKTVEEQQELAQLFGELAYEQVHKISKDNGWDESSPQKIALHAFVGAVMADLGGGDALSGAAGAGVNEAVQKELAKIFKDNPDLHQWASAIIGAAAATVVGGDAQTGGSTAASGTKNNFLSDWQKEQREQAIKDKDWETVAYWDAIDKAQDLAIYDLGLYGVNLNAPENSGLLQTVSKLGQEIAASPDFQGSLLSNAPSVDSSTLIAAGVIGTAVVVAGVTLYKYNGVWVKVAGSSTGTAVVTLKSPELLNELSQSGAKYTAENIVAIEPQMVN